MVSMKRSLFAIAMLLLSVSECLPQDSHRVTVGIKAGVPITGYFQTGSQRVYKFGFEQYSSAPRRYVVGISWEWRSVHRYGIEVDGFYTPVGYAHYYTSDLAASGVRSWDTTYSDVRGHSWDIPALLKYRFRKPSGMFASGGAVFRHLGPVRQTGISYSFTPTPSGDVQTQVIHQPDRKYTFGNFGGLTFGAGVEVGKSWIRFAPELRVTHWINNIGNNAILQLKADQVQLFVGLAFSSHR